MTLENIINSQIENVDFTYSPKTTSQPAEMKAVRRYVAANKENMIEILVEIENPDKNPCRLSGEYVVQISADELEIVDIIKYKDSQRMTSEGIEYYNRFEVKEEVKAEKEVKTEIIASEINTIPACQAEILSSSIISVTYRCKRSDKITVNLITKEVTGGGWSASGVREAILNIINQK